MPFWGEVDSFFTFFCMQASIIMFWIEFYLISTFFCMQLITIVFWTVLDLIFTFFCVQAFLGRVGFDLHPLLLKSDHRDVLD